MGNLGDALLRAGVTPPARQLRPTLVLDLNRQHADAFAPTYTDPAGMSDQLILDEMTAARLSAVDIGRQLADDKDEEFEQRTSNWRGRAKRARRGLLLRADQLEAEAKRRGILIESRKPQAETEAAAIAAASKEARLEYAAREAEARRLHKVVIAEKLLEAARVREAARLERIRLAEQRNDVECVLFLKAARRVLSADECDRIWTRAREMFPRHDWQEGLDR